MNEPNAASAAIDEPCAPPDLNPRNVKTDQLTDMEVIAQKIAPFGGHLPCANGYSSTIRRGCMVLRRPAEICAACSLRKAGVS